MVTRLTGKTPKTFQKSMPYQHPNCFAWEYERNIQQISQCYAGLHLTLQLQNPLSSVKYTRGMLSAAIYLSVINNRHKIKLVVHKIEVVILLTSANSTIYSDSQACKFNCIIREIVHVYTVSLSSLPNWVVIISHLWLNNYHLLCHYLPSTVVVSEAWVC